MKIDVSRKGEQLIFGHRELHASLTDHHVRPDWRTPSDYGYLKGRGNDQIAWEFLRRSEAYQEAFFRWLPLWQNWWHPGVTVASSEVDEGCAALCGRFGLVAKLGPRHPASMIMPEFQERFRPNVQILARWIDGVELDFYEPPPADCLNSFDVRVVADRPLKEQIERIRIIYKDMVRGIERPKNAKLTVIMYATYLRILDALEDRIDLPEITRTLHPKESGGAAYERVKQQKYAAVALANGGYRDLVRPRF